MNAIQLTITDAEHWGDKWASPLPFEIEASVCDMHSLQITAGTGPKTVLALLADITRFVKSEIKQSGAQAFAAGPPESAFTDDSSEVPF